MFLNQLPVFLLLKAVCIYKAVGSDSDGAFDTNTISLYARCLCIYADCACHVLLQVLLLCVPVCQQGEGLHTRTNHL